MATVIALICERSELIPWINCSATASSPRQKHLDVGRFLISWMLSYSHNVVCVDLPGKKSFCRSDWNRMFTAWLVSDVETSRITCIP